MVKGKYVAPELELAAFNCPFCGAFSHQLWYEIKIASDLGNQLSFNSISLLRGPSFVDPSQKITFNKVKPIYTFSQCTLCRRIAIWEESNLIHPNNTTVEQPNADMPEDIKKIYNEASSIVNLSAKSAAALLRLALEKLLIHLGAKKGSIDVMIQDLIDQYVISASGSVRKALDSLRVLGNAGVHPTGINLDEDPNAAFALFKVLNFVVEKLITEEKEMQAIYALIPEEKRENLDNRRSK